MDTSGSTTNPSIVDPDRPADPRATRKAAWAGLVGTTLEQYDFVIYGTASALVFSTLFFPNVSPAVGILASFSAYAVGFLARPLGGLFFSRYGDRLGRKWVLVATLLLMGGSTMLIGLLPTYGTIGILAPALLVLCRFFQGFGAGAEQAGAATLLTETVGRGRRGRYASLVMVGAALGTALGAVVWIAVQQLPEEALMAWGWRLVFLSSLIVTAVAMLIRRKLDESPVFAELKESHVAPRKPAAEVFRHGRRPMLLALFMNIGTSEQSYTFQVFIASYLVTAVGVDSEFVPPVLLIGAICGGIAAFGFGALSDRIGRKPVYSFIMLAIVLLPAPAFVAMNTGNPVAITVTLVVGFVLAVNGAVGVQMSYFPELFGNRYRYAGVTLGREFSAALGGGVAPLICAALLSAFWGSWIPVAIYMSGMALISLVAARMAPETLDRDLTVPEDAGAQVEYRGGAQSG
ncbi:L-Proline/Glycine betaine transporter ProP [Pseudonocardia sp. Ae168_Ps1]|uniref:MFS transporter n=1 Tax=unclassified Pseudonocardia TaxID=2619320 RepID=UPI00094B08D9|nr:MULTISPECIES: MFS transporter [unclassified Pseudonocardia]OLL72812.1 L-Proline/Glycine betaine transporter ProP [Pseudonocardia sp. Ae150A_Ps1]OLL78787.1 L-Proline/Glycine betaine transporter ProP [Pseudonocardia sp. Ae168_Ps1]OLL87087.1 L-Proline/Glycine betaine transporter ProP [Pseudonocardia sp. Ae263_Ps1]OLL92882.1 L-Proline/Glycine betaine transporter ProP [Pseudonocardia sp. Ae356_Ps1]